MITKQVRVRLTAEELKSLESIAEQCGLNATALATVLLKSAVAAVKANNNRISLPLHFQIAQTECAPARAGVLNEPKPKYGGRT